MIWKIIGIFVVLISLLGLAGITLTAGNNNNVIEKQMIENTPSANADPSGTQNKGTQVLTLSQATGLKFSGEILTCTNITDFEQVIDLRISNLDENNIKIAIDYPFGRTIELLPDQIKRIDLPLPYGVSSINISSNDEKMILHVPPCVSGGGSNSHSGFSSEVEQSFQPPPPVPEFSTVALTGIGVIGLIFIIQRSKK